MKKFFKTIFYILIVALAFVVSYIIFINVVKTHVSNNASAKQAESSDSLKGYIELKNYPKVDASYGAQPLCSILAEFFTGEENIDDSVLGYTDTHEAYVGLIEGDKDLIIATEPSDEILEYAKKNNVELETIPVAKEALVFFVNSRSTVSSLTLDQVQNIYSGRATNWNKVGGAYDDIIAFQAPKKSASYEAFVSLVMDEEELVDASVKNISKASGSLLNLVENFDNSMTSIGYSDYYFMETMLENVDTSGVEKYKLLKIDDVEPTTENVKNGSYKLATDFYIVIRKDEKEDSPARTLANAMVSAEVQNLVEEVGYVGVK